MIRLTRLDQPPPTSKLTSILYSIRSELLASTTQLLNVPLLKWGLLCYFTTATFELILNGDFYCHIEQSGPIGHLGPFQILQNFIHIHSSSRSTVCPPASGSYRLGYTLSLVTLSYPLSALQGESHSLEKPR